MNGTSDQKSCRCWRFGSRRLLAAFIVVTPCVLAVWQAVALAQDQRDPAAVVTPGPVGAEEIDPGLGEPQAAFRPAALHGDGKQREWCHTQVAWKAKGLGAVAGAGCPTEGTCDTPAVRDSWIPGVSTPVRALNILFNVFANSDGSSPAATQAGVDAQVVQLNSDFAPSKIQFCYTTEFISDTTYREFSHAEHDAMKIAYADSPVTHMNVYVVNIDEASGYAGLATFPWDPAALGLLGGVIIDDSYFGAGHEVLTHEVGHCIGLWHTHRGVSEFSPFIDPCFADLNACDCPCYERADGLDADITGDFSGDTAPTPTNFACAPPGGIDACSGVGWGPTDPQNYMGYSQEVCWTEFSPHQFGRMHCWSEDVLTSWSPCTGACCDRSDGTCMDDVLVADCAPPLEWTLGVLCADLVPPCAPGPGACCDRSDGTCMDGVLLADCPPPLEWTLGVLCADLGPPCAPGPGACCDRSDGTCMDGVLLADCAPPLEWTLGVMCAALDPPCEPSPGACCDRSDGTCMDGVLLADCAPPLEWTLGVMCAALDPPCAPTGACCDRSRRACRDDVLLADCAPSLEWTSGMLCKDLALPCRRGKNREDPHITTVDGVHYDFQSAGEFVSLLGDGSLRGDGLEIQIRQTPISTPIPWANPNTAAMLETCATINTAVAFRVGPDRVTYQPNISGVPDPSGLQLRVNGILTTLGENGLDLGSGGRIEKLAVGEGIQIDFPDGTTLTLLAGWWPAQSRWYINVDADHTRAGKGTMGAIAPGSWLPALPDGTSLGPLPAADHDRYVALYEAFADAWRVTGETTLFDYAPGTSTATFTFPSWPLESPESCEIPKEILTQPLDDPEIAAMVCAPIVDEVQRANCVFDVTVTGDVVFADTYLLTQQLEGPTGACCDRSQLGGVCVSDVLESQCPVDSQHFWVKGEACIEDGGTIDCNEHTGACCDTNWYKGLGPVCTDDVLPQDCVIPALDPDRHEKQPTWYKDLRCDDPQVMCEVANPIPTVSEWGLVVLTLSILVVAKLRFGRQMEHRA